MVGRRASPRVPPPAPPATAGEAGRPSSPPASSAVPPSTVVPTGVADPPVQPSAAPTPTTAPLPSGPLTPEMLHQIWAFMSQMGGVPPRVGESSSQGAQPPPVHSAPAVDATTTTVPAPPVAAPPEPRPELSASEMRKILDHFMRIMPMRFSGAAAQDPFQFLDLAEERLSTLRVLESLGAEFIGYVLDGDADAWWRKFRDRRAPGSSPLTWEDFRAGFQRRFISRTTRESLRPQFERLEQGSMTISEYESRFLQLSRYGADLIATEPERIRRFLIGLPTDTQQDCEWMVFTRSSFEDVVDYLKKREVLSRQAQGGSEKRPKQQGEYSGSRSGGSSRGGSGQRRYQQGQSSRPYQAAVQASDQRQQPAKGQVTTEGTACVPRGGCFTCGDMGHRARDCPRRTVDRRVPACFGCGDTKHFIQDCPQRRVARAAALPAQPLQALPPAPEIVPAGQGARGGRRRDRRRDRGQCQPQQPQQPQQHHYALPGRAAAEAADDVVTGMLWLCGHPVLTLFDPGSTLSYVSCYVAPRLGRVSEALSEPLSVSTPVGAALVVDRVYRSCVVTIAGQDTRADLVELDMVDFDLILGMDWLHFHRVVMDCFARTVTLTVPGLAPVVWHGPPSRPPVRIISSFRAQRLLSRGCDAYIAYVRDESAVPPSPESVPVVSEFLDVFPDELPGLPPPREIDFRIDVEPGTRPISIPPYRMAPAELRELSSQLQELLDRGFIRPSVSPWGAPVLFVKKKDGSLRMSIDYR